jgi:GNAT superfamily N-acetyltransferase
MRIEIRKLREPYNYKQIADVLRKTYFREYCDAGALQWNEKYARFYFEAVVFKDTSRDFIFGAFDGEKLVGTIFGHRDALIFENRLKLEMVNLGLTAVDPGYRRQGIAKKMVAALLEQAKKKALDVVIAFPEKGRFGDKLLKDHFEFTNFGKTQHFIKLMEDRGLQVVREYLHYNVVMVKLAGMFAHLPEVKDLEGTIRYAKMEEIDTTREILNSYAARVPLVSYYSVEGYKESNIRFMRMNERFGDPLGFHWIVLERDGEIIATISYRVEVVTFEPEPGEYASGPVALLTSFGCREEMERDQKVQFLAAVLQKIRKELPEVYVAQITSPQHEKKVFDKCKFVDDRSTYFFYMRPLSEKAQELHTYKKYKEYLLQYYR